MSLREKLRIAEAKSTGPVRRGLERAKEQWSYVERLILQRMRIYPRKLSGMASSEERELDIDQSDVRLPAGGHVSPPDPEARDEVGKPIVSIHGRDVEDEEIKAAS